MTIHYQSGPNMSKASTPTPSGLAGRPKSDTDTSSPGYILRYRFIKPSGKTIKKTAIELDLAYTTLCSILDNKTRISSVYAIKFECYYGAPAEYWLALQNEYDLKNMPESKRSRITRNVHRT